MEAGRLLQRRRMVSRDNESAFLNQWSLLHRSIKPEPHSMCIYFQCKPFLPMTCKASKISSLSACLPCILGDHVKVSQQSPNHEALRTQDPCGPNAGLQSSLNASTAKDAGKLAENRTGSIARNLV